MNVYVYPGLHSIDGIGMSLNQKIEVIINTACDHYEVNPLKFATKSRERRYVEARAAAFWGMREYTDLSYAEIGKKFRKDHSTIIHNVRNAYNWMEVDEDFIKVISKIKAIFNRELNETIDHESEKSPEKQAEEESRKRDKELSASALDRVLSRLEQTEKERSVIEKDASKGIS